MITKNILYVEDDTLILKGISNLLSSMTSSFQSFDNPKSAIEAISNGLIPELIITDITMPYMNGFEMLAYLKTNHNIDVPVIVTSGNPVHEHLNDIQDFNIIEYLQKPVDVRRLMKLISQNA